MEVILLEPVRNLGNIGDIVSVKNGYARNFLIPRGVVLFANDQNKAIFESKKAEIIKNNEEKKGAADKVASVIENKFITIIRQAGDDGRLFGSVSSKDIADELYKSFKVKIKKSQIDLPKPIKYVGVHSEEVNIHGNVSVSINIIVARNEEEAKTSKEKFLNPEPEKNSQDGDYEYSPKSQDQDTNTDTKKEDK